MNITKLVVAAVAALGLAGAMPATAADLDDRYPTGAAYDDPRYSDIYRHPVPPPAPPRHYAAPYQPLPGYRDERYAAPPPPYVEPGPRYQYQRDGRQGAGCLPQHAIHDRLARHGWQDFHDPQVEGKVAHVRARRPNGRLFDLTVDRCSGEVLHAEVIDPRSAQAPAPYYRDDRNGRY